MADLADVLDVTEPIECDFLNRKITAHLYTSGPDRLTKEERALFNELKDVSVDESGNGTGPKAYDVGIDSLRRVLPVVLKGIDLDGSPLTYRGKEFPDNVPLYPDALLVAIGNPVLDAWNKQNPTSGEPSASGSQPEETQENSPTENITPSSESPLPPSG